MNDYFSKNHFINYFIFNLKLWLLDKKNFESAKNVNEYLPLWFSKDFNANDEEFISDGIFIGKKAREWAKYRYKVSNTQIFDYSDLKFNNNLKANTIRDFKSNGLYFESAFEYNNFRFRSDIIYTNNNSEIELIEVKSSSKFKSEYIFDVLYQYYILIKLGYKISSVKLLLLKKIDDKDSINKIEIESINYLQLKDKIKTGIFNFKDNEIVKKYFNTNSSKLMWKEKEADKNNTFDLMELLKTLYNIVEDYDILSKIKLIIKSKQKEINNLNLIKKDKEIKFLENEFNDDYKQIVKWNYSLKFSETNIVKNKLLTDSIFELYKMNFKSKIKKLNNDGPIALYNYSPSPDLIKGLDSKNTLTNLEKNYIQFYASKLSKDKGEKIGIIYIKKFVNLYNNMNLKDSLLIFYDFETFKSPQPIMDKTAPNQNLCFQYSIHKFYLKELSDNLNIKKANNINKILDFNINDNTIERNHKYLNYMINNFLKDTYNQKNKYIVYNKNFENTRLKELIELILLSEIKNKESLIKKINFIINNTIDIWDYFSSFIIYHPKFGGSTSIKKIIPTLFDDLDHNDLLINNGTTASWEYKKLYLNLLNKKNREEVFKNLIDYCKLDTWSMVLILNLFKKLIDNIKNDKIKSNQFIKIGKGKFKVV